ncbi:MAG: Spx/MgsR family RNA polymerase-binding regulatory protein [Rhizobiaceae bacterium]|nr:Spx/MgsR family RNA polymerase-binding regulatory protein [Rhizobiaceae bacterium]
MSVTIYGFKSCDTVRKALAWLDANGVAHDFFDYRKQQLDPGVVDDWFERAGWEAVFNRGSSAYRALPDEEKADIDAGKAKALILRDTNFIKRPVLDTGNTLLFGFKADPYAQATGK